MYDDSDDSDKELYDELWSEFGSAGTYSIILGGFSCGLLIPLIVTLSSDYTFDGGGESLALLLQKYHLKRVPKNVLVMSISFL